MKIVWKLRALFFVITTRSPFLWRSFFTVSYSAAGYTTMWKYVDDQPSYFYICCLIHKIDN